MKPITFFRNSEEFHKELSAYLKSQGSVIEVFAGNGYLASKLKRQGVDIIATSLFSGHDGHAYGMHHPVTECDAVSAVVNHGRDRDVLLMSWPVVGPDALRAILEWGPERPIVYIGECPNLDLPGLMGLPGCASDEFFETISWDREFASYKGNMLEKAGVIFLKPYLEIEV